MTLEKEIKKAMKDKTLIIGSNRVLKSVKGNTVNCVIRPKNCKQDVLNELEYYIKNFGVVVKEFDGNSRQLGEICAKPFNIMLLGIRK